MTALTVGPSPERRAVLMRRPSGKITSPPRLRMNSPTRSLPKWRKSMLVVTLSLMVMDRLVSTRSE